MGYETERKSITNWLRSQDKFFGLQPFNIGGAPDELVAGGGWMDIISGIGAQASVGSPGANLHEYAGVLQMTIITKLKDGAGPANEIADEIISVMTGLRLNEYGGVADSGAATIINFTRAGVPYRSGPFKEPPFLRTVVNAPFTRTERK